MSELESSETQERHATNLELFLDLVFVFAVTQVTTVLGSGSAAGFGRGMLLTWLVWWQWSQYTWLGTAIDLEGPSMTQFLVLAAVPLALLMAVAIPGAYGATGLEFAGAYLAVNGWALAIQGRGVWADPVTRRSWLQYIPLAALAPCLLMIGSLVDGNARVAVWAVVAAIQIGSAIVAARGGSSGDREWTIDPLHFVERHSLFVIISLGEVLVAIGVSASEVRLTPAIGLGVLAAVAVACACWWIYFAYVPKLIENRLRANVGAERGRMARDFLTFGHFPIVFGIVLYSVAARHMVVDPGAHLDEFNRIVLAGSVAVFVGGFLALQWNAARHLSTERIVVIVSVAASCALFGAYLPGAVLVAGVAVLLVGMQALTLRRFGGVRPT